MSAHWSKTERNTLLTLASDIPWSLVVKTYNEWAEAHGYRQRTDLALQLQVGAAGITRRAEGAYISSGTLSEILGVSWPTVHRWITKGWLPYVKEGCKYYIPRESVVRLAKRAPEHFAGKPYINLLELFDSPSLAQKYHEMKPMVPRGFCKPVRAVELNKVFPSIKMAAQAVYVTPPAIQTAIRKGTKAAGCHWEFQQ